jgi:hypothetical protein
MKAVKRMRPFLQLAVLVAVLLVAGSCRSRTDRSAGPVALTFGNITGIPTIISVTAAVNFNSTTGGVPPNAIGTFTLTNITKDPGTPTSNDLADIETSSYQVIYTRRDSGTRVPPPLIAALTVEVPHNGSAVINNLPLLRLDQLLGPPLSDLPKFGHDTETGTAVIVVDAELTFFGRTVSGDSVASGPAKFTLEFIP